MWNTPHVAIGANSYRRRGRCTSMLAERPDASLKSTTSNPPAGATCERCIARSSVRAATAVEEEEAQIILFRVFEFGTSTSVIEVF